MKGDTSGLRFNTSEKGESFGTKSNVHKVKTSPKAKKPIGKKVFKPICFICHKPRCTTNACRRRPNVNTSYNANARYVSRRFEGHCYICNIYGHRLVECKYGVNNSTPHMNPRPINDWRRTYDNRRNMN